MSDRKQPSTSRSIQDRELSRLIRQTRLDVSASRLMRRDASVANLPGEIGLQLTNRCNLRCSHCFQWGDTGQYHLLSKEFQQQEMDIGIIEQILIETRPVQSRLYVWGGEPLVYRQFDRLMDLIAAERRWTVICTNGIGVERKLEALQKASKHIVMLVSLDGFEQQNDAMRTNGAFAKTVKSIQQLVEAKRQGLYEGEVSIAAVLSDDLIDNLYDFAAFVEDLGVNTLHINFPWYISDESAKRMDAYYERNFSWLRDLGHHQSAGPPSWHSYSYHLDPERRDHVKASLRRLYDRPWAMRLKIQPLMSAEEVDGFVLGSEAAPMGRSQCVSIATRLSVLPSGKVTTCKLFPEFSVGDLNGQSLTEIWNGEHAVRVRQTLAQGLTPVCSRCVQLYLNRPKVPVRDVAYA